MPERNLVVGFFYQRVGSMSTLKQTIRKKLSEVLKLPQFFAFISFCRLGNVAVNNIVNKNVLLEK